MVPACSQEIFLSALSLAFIRVRGQILLDEADEDPTLFAAILDIMRPIPTVLLEWREGSGLKLYEDMLVRAEKHGRLNQARRWLGEAAAPWIGHNENANPEKFLPSRSKEMYFKLLEKALDTMTKRVDDLSALRTYADVFHNLPSNLCATWNKKNEQKAYDLVKNRAQDNGVWEEVEGWLHEIEGGAARTPSG